MNRRRASNILAPCDLSRLGLEIGASFHPIAPKAQGYRVEILDHLSRKDLEAKYAHLPGSDLSRIEEVDHIWDGGRYSALVGGRNRYGWIVASHVIEHVPDLLGFLQDCTDILEPGGVLALAVPDQRFTFDALRPFTAVGSVLDAHLRGDVRPSVGSLTELHLRGVRKGTRINWRFFHLGRIRRIEAPESAKARYLEVRSSSTYEDSHVWCFTPFSFQDLIRDLVLIGELDLELVDVRPRWGLEFHAWLRKPKASAA